MSGAVGPVLVGLGANVGDALATLSAAVAALAELDGFVLEEASGVYRTPAWPPAGQPGHVSQDDYLNLVVRGTTTRTPEDLLDALLAIEAALGRDRSHEVRWGPRVVDLDLLLVGDTTLHSEGLTVPHPRMAERAFVLLPALEVLPGGALPDGRRFTTLLAGLAPFDDITLEVRLGSVATEHVTRPDGPVSPRASLTRPTDDALAREHGA